MKLRPLGDVQRYRRPWCFVVGAGPSWLELLTEEGELAHARSRSEARDLLARLGRHHVVFATDHRALARSTDATRWTYRQRRHRVIDLRDVDGLRVVKVPSVVEPGIEGATGFARYLFWLADHNVWPTARSGWSTMGRHLWWSTLDRRYRLGAPERLGRAGFYGGRKDAPFPARFRDVSHYDISSAYPAALGGARMPLTLRAARDRTVVFEREVDGLARATVDVPDELRFWPPLPVPHRRSRRFLSWGTGPLEGWWTFDELRMAADYDCRCAVHEAWAGVAAAPLFDRWLALVADARSVLDVSSVALAKSHANALWSSFSVAPARIVTKRFLDPMGARSEIIGRQESGDFTRTTAYVSSIVAGRVRARLFREALAPDGRCDDTVIYVDTDGIMGRRDALPSPAGDGPGLWREDRIMPLVEIRAPSAYRYLCADCGATHAPWHYRVAGARSVESAQRRFERAPRRDVWDETTEGLTHAS